MPGSGQYSYGYGYKPSPPPEKKYDDFGGKISTTTVTKYNNAEQALKDAQKILSAAKYAANRAKVRLLKTKVTAIRVYSNTIELTIGTTPSPFPHNSLNENHYLDGVYPGFNGRADSDVTIVDSTHIKYSQSRSDMGIKATKGLIYSHNKSLQNRKAFQDADWQELALGTQATKYKVTFPEGKPTSGKYGDWNVVDDVEWYSQLIKYVGVCEKWVTTKTKARDAAKKDYEAEAKIAGVKIEDKKDDNGTGTGTKKKKKKKSSNGTTKKGPPPTVYNLPAVKEMHFGQTPQFEQQVLALGGEVGEERDFTSDGYRTQPDPGGSTKWVGATPKAVEEAKQLWASAGAYKGMIQSYIVNGNLSKDSKWFAPALKNIKNINKNKFGFQFQFNPSTVSMNYAGAPQVDVGLEISGADKIPLIGSSVTSSTVSFQLLINRMNDMKYVDYLIQNPGELTTFYPYLPPVGKDYNRDWTGDLKRIRDMGTMYDVEFLLRTLIGYELPSLLRGNTTADVGYLGAYPVELHLGKNLRYLVTIDSFALSHTIFTQDMVPVFSNLSITCNRLPEYQDQEKAFGVN